ncbi:MAG: class I SAM-dependent methyltransferase [Alphaproteobacteria bacterium]
MQHKTKEVADGYETIAEWFDANRTKNLMEREYLSIILERAKKHGSVLDLGCGSGEPLAKYFIDHGFSVTGIDIAAKMIAICNERFPAQEWMVGDIRDFHLNRTFDVILAFDSFFHIAPDAQRKMFPLFRDHAADGALLMFTSGPKEGEVYGTMEGIDFYHASLDTEEYRTLLNSHGFEVLVHKIEDPAVGERTVWLAQKTTKEI